MDIKRILRGPAIWVILGLVAIVGAYTLMTTPTFTQVDTSKAITLINTANQVESATLVNGDQRLELTLKTPVDVDGTKQTRVFAYYVQAREGELVTLLEAHAPEKGYNDEVPKQSWVGAFFLTWLPMIAIVLAGVLAHRLTAKPHP